jgi:hypothetical protein
LGVSFVAHMVNPGQALLQGAVVREYLRERQEEIEPGAEHHAKVHGNEELRPGVWARLRTRVRGRRATRTDRA